MVLALYLLNNLALPYLLGDHGYLGGLVFQVDLGVPKFPSFLWVLKLGKKSGKIGKHRYPDMFYLWPLHKPPFSEEAEFSVTLMYQVVIRDDFNTV